MRTKSRSRRGASMIALVTLIAFFVVLPLSLVGFEMGRYFLLLTQLQNVASACALSGTGAIATIPSTASSGSALEGLYNGCAQEAVYCFQLNSLLGSQNAGAIENIYNNTPYGPYVAPPKPGVGKANISIAFVELDGKWHTNLQQPGAVRMAVTISYTTKPIFSTPGMILSLDPTITATASSTGGLPQLDVFLCFDISGSMDDQTGVAYVNRYWDPVKKTVAYNFDANQGGLPNTIYYQSPNITIVGTAMNACPPQNLNKRDKAVYFNPLMRCDPSAATEAGQLPGGCSYVGTTPTAHDINYPNGNQTYLNPSGTAVNPEWLVPYPGFPSFTDLVVIPSDDPDPTATYKVPANWKETAVIEVEQSRGNLKTLALLDQSQGGAAAAAQNPYYPVLKTKVGATPQQYWAYAAKNSTPVNQALEAAQNFVNTMNLSSDARFGLCTFADDASKAGAGGDKSPPTAGSPDQYLISNWSSAAYPDYKPGGQPGGNQYPLPWVSISEGINSYQKAKDALAPPTASYDPTSTANTQITALTQTNMYSALDNGLEDLIQNGRTTSRWACVLFTDGIPTPTITNNNETAITNLVTAKCVTNSKNIPVYTIGLAQGANATLVTQEKDLLTKISQAGYPGGKYFGTQSAKELNDAFQQIARGLVLLRAAN